MTGHELHNAREARAAKMRRLKNLQRAKEAERTASKRIYNRRRDALTRCFGVKTPAALFEMWRRGEIQIVKDGAVIDYDQRQP